MYRSLQLSLLETLIYYTLVEIVDSGRDTEKINQWLVESERIYEGMKEECELIKRGGEGT